MSRSVLILTLVFVVALAVVGLGLYEWIQIATYVPPVPKPTITLSGVTTLSVGYQWSLAVASASSAAGPTNFRLNLAVNTFSGSPVSMPTYGGASVYVYVPTFPYQFMVQWGDLDGSGTLSTGDGFLITYTGYSGVPAGSSMVFTLSWSDASTVASASWTA